MSEQTPVPTCRVRVERMDGARILFVEAQTDVALHALAATLARWPEPNRGIGVPRVTVEAWS